MKREDAEQRGLLPGRWASARGQASAVRGGRGGAVLPPGGRQAHCSDSGGALGTLDIVTSFPLQSPDQEPHCSSSSQEIGLEKTSLSNQRS